MVALNDAHRDRLKELIRGSPGLSTRELATKIGLSETTTAYHLKRLERAGDVRSETVGRRCCWFATLCGICPILRAAIPVLAAPATASVARALEATPRTVAELAAKTGVSRGQARWAVSALEETLLVERSSAGRTALRAGAEVCLEKAIRGETCALWGQCAMSAAWQAKSEK